MEGGNVKMENNELYHHGVKGMKWGVRRYQNKDGTLTKAGQRRYDKEVERLRQESKTLTNKKRTAQKLERLESMRKKVKEKEDDYNKTYSPKKPFKKSLVKKKESPKELKIELIACLPIFKPTIAIANFAKPSIGPGRASVILFIIVRI